ncbi:MAG: hypothetical protein KDD33_05345 [Bdellovibrionales bacterium]|nr:hypothetical protein [Bdellovibrionales bacterium]
MNILISYLAVITLILALGCTTKPKTQNPRNFIISENDFSKKSSIFTKKLASKDIEILLQFFRNGYSGYEFIEKPLIDKAESELKSLPHPATTSWDELCESIAVAFNRLPDAHLQAYHLKNCLPKSLSSDRKSDIGKNIAVGYDKKAYKVQTKKRNGKTIGIIGITRFPAFDDTKWEGFETAIAGLKKSSAIIIDLRGNSGGDDSRGLQLAGLLKGEDVIKADYAMDYERTNPETYILILNKMISKARNGSEGAWDRYEKHYREKLNNPPSKNYTSSFGTSSLNVSTSSGPYNKPVYVLIDSDCGSSGESSMQALRTLKNVKVVGQNTAGVTHFGNQGLLILPNSRIRISMSTKFIKFNDGSFVEKVGHKPDIEVPNGTNALEFVLNTF